MRKWRNHQQVVNGSVQGRVVFQVVRWPGRSSNLVRPVRVWHSPQMVSPRDANQNSGSTGAGQAKQAHDKPNRPRDRPWPFQRTSVQVPNSLRMCVTHGALSSDHRTLQLNVSALPPQAEKHINRTWSFVRHLCVLPNSLDLQVPSEKVGLGWVPGGSVIPSEEVQLEV